MLAPRTPYPQQGSYALLTDEGRTHLVRILRNTAFDLITVNFPLREGAGGTKSVPLSDLIDATELDGAEQRELTDLERWQRGHPTSRRSAKHRRLHVLKQRAVWAPFMRARLRELRVPA